MSISATFGADFSNFVRATQDAQSQLVSFEAGAGKVQSALGRMETALSGRKLIQDATLMAQAVDNIGGPTKLTTSELEKMGNTAAAAVDKMRALGLDVPANIQAIADASKKAATSLEQVGTASADASKKVGSVGLAAEQAAKSGGIMGSTFGQVFAAFSAASLISKAVGGIADLGVKALESAGSLVDLSNKTGLSTDTIQRMGFVAKQNGTDMQVFSDAAFKLGVNISEGTAKAREGAEALGLNWKELRAASPDVQFNSVVQALERMEDPQKRNAAAVELFGKSAKEIIPAIVDGYTKIASQATVAGDAQVRALDSAGDAWDRFKTRQIASVTQALGNMVLLHNASVELTADEKQFVLQTMAGEKSIENYNAALIAAAEAKAKFGNISAPTSGADISLPGGGKTAAIPKSFAADLAAAKAGFEALTSAQVAEIDAAIRLGKSNNDIIDQLNITDGVLAVAKKAFEDHKAALEKAAAAALAWAKVVADVGSVGDDYRKTILGIDGAVVEQSEHLLKAGADAKAVAEYYGLTETQIKALQRAVKDESDAEKILSDIRDKFESGTLKLNDAMRTVNSTELTTIKEHLDLAQAMHLVEKSIPPTVDGFHGLGENITAVGLKSTELDQVKLKVEEVDKATKLATDQVANLANAFSQAGSQIGGSFGQALSSLSHVLTVADQAEKHLKDVQAAFGVSSPQAASAASAGKTATINAAVGAGAGLLAQTINTGPGASTGSLVASGALQGAAAGSVAGPWGTAIGAGAGAIVGWIQSGQEWRKVVNDISRDMGGIKVSEDFAKMISDLEDQTGLQRTQALTTQIDQLVAQVGGLRSDNIDLFTSKLRDAFSYLQVGQLTLAETTQTLDKNFANFATVGTDAYGRLQDNVKELITLNQQYGTQSQAIASYLQQQGAAAISGLVAVTTATTQPILDAFAAANNADAALEGGITGLGEGMQKASGYTAGLSIQIKDVTAQIATLESKKSLTTTQVQSLSDLHTKLLTLQAEWGSLTDTQQAAGDALDAMAAKGKQGLQDLGLQAIASFAAAVAAGTPLQTALTQIHPALDALKQSYADLGLSINDVGLQNLIMQDTILSGNPALVGALQGLTGEMVSLDNMGLLNVDTFQAMQRTGLDMYTRLQDAAVEAGGTTKDALLPMQDWLHQATIEAKNLGIPLDDNTQELISQSKELGIWKDAGESAADKVTDAMQSLVDKVGELIDRLNGIPTKINTNVNVNTTTTSTPADNKNDPTQPDGPYPQASGGDYWVTKPTLFLAGEAGPERASFGGASRASGTQTTSGGNTITITVPVNLDGREITRIVVPLVPSELRRMGVI